MGNEVVVTTKFNVLDRFLTLFNHTCASEHNLSMVITLNLFIILTLIKMTRLKHI